MAPTALVPLIDGHLRATWRAVVWEVAVCVCVCVVDGDSVLSAQFCCEPKTVWENEVKLRIMSYLLDGPQFTFSTEGRLGRFPLLTM